MKFNYICVMSFFLGGGVALLLTAQRLLAAGKRKDLDMAIKDRYERIQ